MTKSNRKHPATRRYPPELRERAVRMVHETIAAEDGQSFGVIRPGGSPAGRGDRVLAQLGPPG